jgi:hypothetical protein
MKRLKLWIIAIAIRRVPQLVTTAVQLAAAKVALGGIMGEGAEAAVWEHVAAALVLVATAAVQWVGSKWAGTGIAESQAALGTLPDGLPGPATIAAARQHKSNHPAK